MAWREEAEIFREDGGWETAAWGMTSCLIWHAGSVSNLASMTRMECMCGWRSSGVRMPKYCGIRAKKNLISPWYKNVSVKVTRNPDPTNRSITTCLVDEVAQFISLFLFIRVCCTNVSGFHAQSHGMTPTNDPHPSHVHAHSSFSLEWERVLTAPHRLDLHKCVQVSWSSFEFWVERRIFS